MIVLDTNLLVRFFTNDDKKKAEAVKIILEGDEEIVIPDVVFPELEYVLMGDLYKMSREVVLKAFRFLIAQENISVSLEVRKAVYLYERAVLDMADVLIAASAMVRNGALATFDKKLMQLSGLKVYEFDVRS